MKKIIVTALYFFLLCNLHANDKKELETDIYKNLRCLVCQGQSIADSNSDFAQTIKLVVKDKIKEGKKRDEIYDFLIEKYGDWKDYKPQVNKNNFLLWFLPYIVLALGGLIIVFAIKKKGT
jgi:cytochrome c-type biogenesis protein CcmH